MNRKTKQAFSVELIQDHDEKTLEERIRERTAHKRMAALFQRRTVRISEARPPGGAWLGVAHALLRAASRLVSTPLSHNLFRGAARHRGLLRRPTEILEALKAFEEQFEELIPSGPTASE